MKIRKFAAISIVLYSMLMGIFAAAQDTNWDFPSVQVMKGELISPTNAFAYYQQNGLTYPSPSEEYHPHTDSRFVELAQTLGFDANVWAGLSAADLVQAKVSYVNASYLYVRNGVEFTPLYGLQHGAMGAIYHGSGTSFDQAHLLVELMHVADITAVYQIGDFNPTADEFYEWFGTRSPKTACEILANGGIPATVNNQDNCSAFTGYLEDMSIDVTLSHIWVKINISGTNYLFDPAFKQYQIFENKIYGSEFDLFAKSGITKTGVLSGVGGTHSGMTYAAPNPKGLRAYLSEQSEILFNALQAEDDIVSTLYALGGRRLYVTNDVPMLTSLPGHSANVSSGVTRIPNELTAFIDIGLEMGRQTPSYQGSVQLPLSRIGADIVILSPIKLTNGGRFSDGTGVFTAADSSRFELSIFRPGSSNSTIHSNTGSSNGRASSYNPVDETSGYNLLDISMSLQDAVDGNWNVEIAYNAPFAANFGKYSDRISHKRADNFTASALIIQTGHIEKSVSKLYERFISKKSNLWYGLYIDNSADANKCSATVQNEGVESEKGKSCSITGSRIKKAKNCDPGAGATLEEVSAYYDVRFLAGLSNGDGGGGGVSPPCYPILQNSSIPTVSHNKRIRLKSLSAAQWHKDVSNVSSLYGALAGGYGQHTLSLGVVTASVFSNPDLSMESDALLMDIDTTLVFASQESSRHLNAYGVACAAGLSATEGLILQSQTGAPRVDSAVTKNDWYAWNAQYDSISGIHNGPYGRDYDSDVTIPDNDGNFYGFVPGNTLAEVETIMGTGYADEIMDNLAAGFSYIFAEEWDLGPVESYQQEGPPLAGEAYSYAGREGRKHSTSGYKVGVDKIGVIHLVGLGKKGGTGVILPEYKAGELDQEALTTESYKKAYGEFSVDNQSGDFSFEQEDELVVGSGSNALSFSRTYESIKTGSGVLGQGWSHNHDAKIIVSTDLNTAFGGGQSPNQSVASIIAAFATMEIAKGAIENDDWTVLINSLLIHAWMAENVLDNQVTVTASTGSDTFYRNPNNHYVNNSNPTATLTQTGRPKFFEAVKPYIPPLTKQELVVLGIANPTEAFKNPLYAKRNWVIYEQYWDYSEVNFVYANTNKTIMEFPRGHNLTTDNLPLSCFPDSTRAYRSESLFSIERCGKENGSWPLSKTTSVTGHSTKYCYGTIDGVADCAATAKTGGLLLKVVNERYGNELNFEYESNSGGVVFNRNASSADNSDDPLWVLGQSNFMPDSAVTHGQLFRLKTVSTNAANGPTLTFNYDPSTHLLSPILASVTNNLGATHTYSYIPVIADGNAPRDRMHVLSTFVPASLSVPVFVLNYSPLGRVMSLMDGDGRSTQYGINGVRNVVTNPLGNKTVSHYDSEGRLIIQISPSYEAEE